MRVCCVFFRIVCIFSPYLISFIRNLIRCRFKILQLYLLWPRCMSLLWYDFVVVVSIKDMPCSVAIYTAKASYESSLNIEENSSKAFFGDFRCYVELNSDRRGVCCCCLFVFLVVFIRLQFQRKLFEKRSIIFVFIFIKFIRWFLCLFFCVFFCSLCGVPVCWVHEW